MLLRMAIHISAVILKLREVITNSPVVLLLTNAVTLIIPKFSLSFIDDAEEDGVETGFPRRFVGRLVNLEEIRQYVQEYERGNDVELWQIRYVKPKA